MAGQTLSSTGHGGRDEKGGNNKRREEPSEVVYMLSLKGEYHDAVFLKNVFFFAVPTYVDPPNGACSDSSAIPS